MLLGIGAAIAVYALIFTGQTAEAEVTPDEVVEVQEVAEVEKPDPKWWQRPAIYAGTLASDDLAAREAVLEKRERDFATHVAEQEAEIERILYEAQVRTIAVGAEQEAIGSAVIRLQRCIGTALEVFDESESETTAAARAAAPAEEGAE